MSTRNAFLRTLLAGCVVLQSLAPTTASADHVFGRIKRLITEATYHGSEPPSCEVGAIEELAENIDWLEHHIDTYGSVVAKQPDIWGEARLTKHRDEYERMMYRELNQFKFTTNAAISQGDSAFLAQAIALSNAAAGATSSVPADPDAGAVAISVANAQLRDVDDEASTSFGRFGITDATRPDALGIRLEPTLFLDQMSRYLQHLHELRRINEGDDTSDSPGYSLNLVRLPVSILPGKLTREGFGAEVTVTATPVLTDDLLPTTFRNLVINDVVHQLRLPVTRQAEAIVRDDTNNHLEECPSVTTSRAPEFGSRALEFGGIGHQQEEGVTLVNANLAIQSHGAAQSAQLHFSPSRAVRAFGERVVHKIACEFLSTYDGRYLRWNGWTNCKGDKSKDPEQRVDLLDVQGWLDSETAAAYELLRQPKHLCLFAALASPSSRLGAQIRGGHFADAQPHGGPTVEDYRTFFFQWLHAPTQQDHLCSLIEATQQGCDIFGDPALLKEVHDSYKVDSNGKPIDEPQPNDRVEALAWAIVVESALLNDHLNQDVRKLATAKEVYGLSTSRDHWFFLPDSVVAPGEGLEPLQAEFHAATEVFQEYVKSRWPIHVFAVDPREQDQNVADVSNRKREMQFALALGFATGKIGVNSLTQYSRELDTQIETIGLNRTIVGFGHGADTFGWRFYPRVQALHVPGTLGVLRETLMGTSRDYDLKHRQLEPGARECVAVVLMPSFVPYADFDIRTNWFKLTNPKNAALTMKDSVHLSRAITKMRNSKAQCSRCAHLYREGEVDRLMKRVQQLDRELPLQTQRALVPYENTLGGFEMFNTGVTDLSPQLIGWYGAPGVNIKANPACGCYQGCQQINATCTGADDCTKLNQQLTTLKGNLEAMAQLRENAAQGGTAAAPLAECEGPGTTLFLVGENFSVHDTKVIAGGVCIPHVQLISREIMQVTIPACVNTVTLCENGKSNEYVSVYIATPYGVTNHLHVPVTGQSLTRDTQTAIAEAVKDAVTEEVSKQVRQFKAQPIDVAVDFAPASPKKLEMEAKCDGAGVMSLTATVTPSLNFFVQNPTLQGKATVEAAFYDGKIQPQKFAVGALAIRAGDNIKLLDDKTLQAAVQSATDSLRQTIEGTLLDKKKHSLKLGIYFQSDAKCCAPYQVFEVDVEVTLKGGCGPRSPASGAGAAPDAADDAPGAQTDCGCGPRLADWSPWKVSQASAGSEGSVFRLAQFDSQSAFDDNVLADINTGLQETSRRLAALESAITAGQPTAPASADATNDGGFAAPPVAPTQVNVSVAPPSVTVVPEARHKHRGDHPLLQQMKTRTGECWRNLRDQLPGY
ncbi:hypothetical protein Pla108_29270 [Botrimarina colliarenosi]|uniref:IPT/TIG domain-containing protein n=1 Tax=Botrimarina colliarenosi TaxID=2528001 RepID=A0A5C6A8Z6_9BACT|nr:hypothetical protein [Botrimarina colliarenosi]TWT95850.1 hypothetical protein Pla108_29270 [Botrimarina colliarenosi]